jgi:putative endonuclease
MQILKVLTAKRITGNAGEDAVARMLRRRGYKIAERNYVAAGHEIDIIAKNREYLCFVEVKTRTEGHSDIREARPAAAVTPEKQRSIIAAAREYLASVHNTLRISFDVAEVIVSEKNKVISINYIDGAFNVNTAFQKR